ncbi:GntR family transcriptional regulator [Govanella unica]|uniref:GntR family transcriptional regulator n=1 Tax=Govanella unica TaxID=2975056 RepID=A0A9X3TWL9_9PROT|nr:GntR family transcriptional regulator [Govania unica]MDA5192924.1 GntR family transcriptional regulator [Govania unica]
MKSDASTAINPDLHMPRYAQVYSVLRHWIQSGVYQPGARLPSESELCTMFEVSRITLRNAVDMLVREKLIDRIQGRGTFVVEDLGAAPNVGDMDQLIRKLQRLSARSIVENVTIAEIPAESAVAKDLRVDPGTPVLRASFTRVVGDMPVGYTELFFPTDIGAEIKPEQLNTSPAPTLLESLGYDILGADQIIGASLADSNLANLLQIQVGAPLVRIRMLVFEKQHRPIERIETYYRADHYEHHTFLSRSTDMKGK